MKKLLRWALLAPVVIFGFYSCSSDPLTEEEIPQTRTLTWEEERFLDRVWDYASSYQSNYAYGSDIKGARVVTAAAVAAMLLPTDNLEDVYMELYHSIDEARMQLATRGEMEELMEEVDFSRVTAGQLDLSDSLRARAEVYRETMNFFKLLNRNFYQEWSQSLIDDMITSQVMMRTRTQNPVDLTMARILRGSIKDAVERGYSSQYGYYNYESAWWYMIDFLRCDPLVTEMVGLMMPFICSPTSGVEVVEGLENLFEQDPFFYQVLPRVKAEKAFKVLYMAVEAADFWIPFSTSLSTSSVPRWDAGNYTIYVKTRPGTEWQVRSHPSFVTLNKTRGTGSGSITISFTRNNTSEVRSGNIIFEFPGRPGETYEFPVNQQAITPITFDPDKSKVKYGYMEVKINAQSGQAWDLYQVSNHITPEFTSGTGTKVLRAFVQAPRTRVVGGDGFGVRYNSLPNVKAFHYVDIDNSFIGTRRPYFYPAGHFLDAGSHLLTIEVDAARGWALGYPSAGNGWTAMMHPQWDPSNGYLLGNIFLLNISANTSYSERIIEVPINYTNVGGSETRVTYTVIQKGR